jgi:hypothetical protein
MTKQAEIQIWHQVKEPITLSDNLYRNPFRVRIIEEDIELPVALEKEVSEKWTLLVQEKEKLIFEDQVLYLKNLEIQDTNTQVEVIKRGFRYAAIFNRNLEFHERIGELNKYSLLTISTHVHFVTSDNKLIFGTKKNQGNQISGFSGFPNADKDSKTIGALTYQDMYRTLKTKLGPEAKGLMPKIDMTFPTGVIYVGTPGLRGTDADYLARLEIDSENVQTLFKESHQFDKGLYLVDFKPVQLAEFIKNIHAEGKTISRYALGAMVLETGIFHSPREERRLMDVINEFANTSMIHGNQTDYFS